MHRKPPIVLAMLLLSAVATALRAEDSPTPGELLQKNVGVWDGVIELWVGGEQETPVQGSVVERTRLLRDGLWIVSDFEMNLAGLTIEGAAQFGFDGRKKKFVGSMIESSNSQLAIYEGHYDPATKTTVFTADLYDPLFTKTVTRKLETRFETVDRRVVTLWIAPLPEDSTQPAKFTKFLETTYTRRSSTPAK